ncbi:hypothetical protein J8I29_19305 [Labrys sp. LIt4]|uniref:hypothetical protein n=1 Tax=Labrys sp. LIt4 TaxID=2821355 RepID=UPI001ADF79E0|nr:hypothetical protein [Labrys sp. LIt4]MBP0581485.1 hypothetical protein [Labrys sp. LIt4]
MQIVFAITTAEDQTAAIDGWYTSSMRRDDRVANLRRHLMDAASDRPLVEVAWALENALVILRRGGLHLSAELSEELTAAVHQAFARAADRLPLHSVDVFEGFAAILDVLGANTEFGGSPRPMPNFLRRELHHRTGLFRAQLEVAARRAELELLANSDDTSSRSEHATLAVCSLLAFRSLSKRTMEQSL